MPKYRVTTEDGVYEVTTEDPKPSAATPLTMRTKSGQEIPIPGMPPAPNPFASVQTLDEDKAKAWAHSQVRGSPVGRFVDSSLEGINPVNAVKNTVKAIASPIETSKAMWQAQTDEFPKGVQSYNEGRYLDAGRHFAANAIPIVGPLVLGQMGDKMQTDQWPEAMGDAAAFGITTFGPRALARSINAARVRGPLKNVNNPVEEAALQSVEGDVPMSAGQRSGNRALTRIEQALENAPMSSSRVQQFFSDQQSALGKKGRDLAAQAGAKTNDYGAGKSVLDRGVERIARLKDYADQKYAEVRQGYAANQTPTVVGQQVSPIVTANGQPITTPVVQMLNSPVELAPIRAQLQPVYDDLIKLMPEAQRQASPAFAALRNFMETPETVMPALDFDQNIGAIKAILRDGRSPYLSSQSQGIARQIVSSAESQLAKSLPADVLKKLQQGRSAVQGYYKTADLLEQLGTDPAAIYKNLVSGGDVTFNRLKELQQIAPKEVRTIGRTFLEDLLDKTSAEGGFGKAETVYNAWNKLGPETKNLLYGQRASDLDKFFLAAKKITKDVNPSGTAKMTAALGGLGEAGAAMMALMQGTPETAAAIAAAAPATRAVTELLLRPGGYKLLTEGVSVATPLRLGAQTASIASGTGMSRMQDPFKDLSDADKRSVLQNLQANGMAEVTVNGQKRMWRRNQDGSIRRLR